MARAKRTEHADEDEKPPAALPTDQNCDHLMRLLSWGRANGYRIGPTVQVGDVIVQVADIRQAKKDLDGGPTERTVYEEAGLTESDEPAPGTAG